MSSGGDGRAGDPGDGAARAAAAGPSGAPGRASTGDAPSPSASAPAAHGTAPVTAAWAAGRERGSARGMRLMAWIATRLGRPAARLLLHPIAAYFLLAAAGPRRHSARYLARVLGRPPRWRERYRHFHTFAATVLDRLWFVRGDTAVFDLSVSGDAGCDATLAEGRGGFLIGAHLGSFEALHAAGNAFPGMQVTLVMYPEHAQRIHGVLQALAPQLRLAVIAIGQPGSTLAIRDALDANRLVGLLGDRVLDAAAGAREGGRSSVVALPFLGTPARFGDGPLRLAMLLRRRVIFMVGLYRGANRYEVRFETMADFRDPPRDAAAREALVAQALAAYVARLESLCREAPFNWFNFYDYWDEDDARR